MDLSALETRFRTLSGDHGVPALWPTEEVTGFLNAAEREAAERARLLHDKTNPAVTQIPLVIGQRNYRLHPKVLDVLAISLQRPGVTDLRRWEVHRTTDEDMRHAHNRKPTITGWPCRFHVYGQPDGAGTAGMHLQLDRAPDIDGGILHLEVDRYPLLDMIDPDDEPEIAPRDHDALVHWALWVAYSTRDMEGSASERALRHLGIFEARFGERDDANVRRKKVRHRAPVVRQARF